jgi:phosphatidylinositol-3-phosphatase
MPVIGRTPKKAFIAAAMAAGLLPAGMTGLAAPSAETKVSASAPCAGKRAGAPPATWKHVTLIVFENKPLKRIIGNTDDAPYLNRLANVCSYSSNTRALSATSLANYIALTSGYTGCKTANRQGRCTTPKPITANKPPEVWPQDSKSIFALMNRPQPGSAVEWAEGSRGNCYTGGEGLFTVTHTPFPYYTRTAGRLCQRFARPFPAAPRRVLSAKYNLVIPNKENIMHLVPNTTVSERIENGDDWLSGYLPKLLSSRRYTSGNTAILITWDEGNANDFVVPLIVITPYTRVGGVSTVAYNHYSTLKGIQGMLGFSSPLLGHAADRKRSSIRADSVFRLRPRR